MNDRVGFEKLVVEYLEFLLAEDFNFSHTLESEFLFTENIVTDELVIVQNFSSTIQDNDAIRNYLLNIISNINLRIINSEDMWRILHSK